MKKFIAIVIALSICLAFAGCSSNTDTGPNEVDISKFPNASDYPVVEWPSVWVGIEIPAITWSNRGNILINVEDRFWCHVGYTTLEDYNNYVEACQEMGYTKNTYNEPDYMYYGENNEGYAVQLTYLNYSQYVAILLSVTDVD